MRVFIFVRAPPSIAFEGLVAVFVVSRPAGEGRGLGGGLSRPDGRRGPNEKTGFPCFDPAQQGPLQELNSP